MDRQSRVFVAVVTAAILIIALASAVMQPAQDVQAAPLPVPTPVSVTRPAGDGYVTFNPFSAAVLDEDTTSACYDVGGYSVVDVLYVIDQGTTNTVTLTSKWSIDGETAINGVNIVANNAADASDMAQLQVFGRYLCVLANLTNTNDLTVTVQAMAK